MPVVNQKGVQITILDLNYGDQETNFNREYIFVKRYLFVDFFIYEHPAARQTRLFAFPFYTKEFRV